MYNKSEMADGCHFEKKIEKIAISEQWYDRSPVNLAN